MKTKNEVIEDIKLKYNFSDRQIRCMHEIFEFFNSVGGACFKTKFAQDVLIRNGDRVYPLPDKAKEFIEKFGSLSDLNKHFNHLNFNVTFPRMVMTINQMGIKKGSEYYSEGFIVVDVPVVVETRYEEGNLL